MRAYAPHLRPPSLCTQFLKIVGGLGLTDASFARAAAFAAVLLVGALLYHYSHKLGF